MSTTTYMRSHHNFKAMGSHYNFKAGKQSFSASSVSANQVEVIFLPRIKKNAFLISQSYASNFALYIIIHFNFLLLLELK
jgi:hypothetical protein